MQTKTSRYKQPSKIFGTSHNHYTVNDKSSTLKYFCGSRVGKTFIFYEKPVKTMKVLYRITFVAYSIIQVKLYSHGTNNPVCMCVHYHVGWYRNTYGILQRLSGVRSNGSIGYTDDSLL